MIFDEVLRLKCQAKGKNTALWQLIEQGIQVIANLSLTGKVTGQGLPSQRIHGDRSMWQVIEVPNAVTAIG